MTVLCINCQNFNLQAAGRDLAVIGFGRCEAIPGYAHKSARYSRECDNFVSAPDGVAENRRGWLEAKMDNAKVSGERSESAALTGSVSNTTTE